MYVTRPLSQLLKFPESLAAPPEGPNSGFLVIQDQESETYSCFGCCKNRTLKDLPFPQNKEFVTTSTGENTHFRSSVLNPVLNQPLSSNRYYAIVPHRKRKGEAFTCSREEDKATCCFCRCVKDVKPRPLDPHNIYQQLKIVPYEALCSPRGSFFAESVAPDGFPPYFFRRKGWTIYTKTPDNFQLDTAQGLDSNLRARCPGFDFPPSQESSETLVVGKWYCPFMFVKEGTVRDQVKRSMYYEVTMEQRWERIFACQKNTYGNQGNSVVIDALVDNKEVFVGGSKAVWNEKSVQDGVIWFTSYGPGGEQMSVGLRVEVMERMKWEQARGGWVGGGERQARINKVEELKEGDKWSEFGCYVLVERNTILKDLPFPQDKELTLQYTTGSGVIAATQVFLIPVLNHPLSSNRYYAIVTRGMHKGEAFTCSREEDKGTCCFCSYVRDVRPRPLDPHNMYQQLRYVQVKHDVPAQGGVSLPTL
ncbi:UNVERIFIED_CONTAM: hypothetical protein Slati_1823100 [Sesamum latifolium]|uniref:Uncharacterized protein n=1 Tax=Sesamum latifolium TaxID=2727402 RepID=A0AAW2WYD7_9LAMI